MNNPSVMFVRRLGWRACNRQFSGIVRSEWKGFGYPNAYNRWSCFRSMSSAKSEHLEVYPPPLVGSEAPGFEADALMPSGQIQKLSLSNILKNKEGVALLFYPLNFTFVCPSELLAFNQRIKDFDNRNWQVLGVSVDSVYSHEAWCRFPLTEGGVGPLSFPLISDITKKISKSYNLLIGESVALRGLVLIDKTMKIRNMTINDLPLGRSVGETIRLIEMIKEITQNPSNVCPANWNKGDRTMPSTYKGVKDYLSDLYTHPK